MASSEVRCDRIRSLLKADFCTELSQIFQLNCIVICIKVYGHSTKNGQFRWRKVKNQKLSHDLISSFWTIDVKI